MSVSVVRCRLFYFAYVMRRLSCSRGLLQIAASLSLQPREVRIISGGIALTEDAKSLAELKLTPRAQVHVTKRVKVCYAVVELFVLVG